MFVAERLCPVISSVRRENTGLALLPNQELLTKDPFRDCRNPTGTSKDVGTCCHLRDVEEYEHKADRTLFPG